MYAIRSYYELAVFLEKNPEVRLVLAGYTDGVGSEGYNIVLSKKRAESVFDYLMAHRITSYNVCYTKLLRPEMAIAAGLAIRQSSI